MQRKRLSKKISLYGVSEKTANLPRKDSIPMPRPSIVCSESGMGIQVQQNEHQYFLSLLTKTLPNLNLTLHQKYILSHSNKYKKKFNKLMIFLTAYSVLSSLYFLAFQDVNWAAFIFDQLVWGLFILDFILNFFTDYVDRKEETVKNFSMIAVRYLKGLMIPDFIALIPLRFVGYDNGEYIMRQLRILKISRIWKLVKIYKIADWFADIVYKEECVNKKKLKIKIHYCWDIAKEMISIFFATYFLACVWYYYIGYIVKKKNVTNDFISNFGLGNDPLYTQFIKSWYFIFTTLSTVGYGDFYATNRYEMGFDIILVLAGSTWFAFTMGHTINIIRSLQDLSRKSEEKSLLRLWVGIVEQSTKPLPLQLKEKIFTHFTNHWKNDRLDNMYNNSTMEKFDLELTNDPIFRELPLRIQEEVLEYIFSDIFYAFTGFFRSFHMARYDICRFLQPRIYSKGEKIIKEGKFIQEVFFKQNGVVQAAITKKDEVVVNVLIYKNTLIGDYYVMKNIKSGFMYSAVNNVKGYSVPSFALKEISKTYDWCATEYLESIQSTYDELEDFLNEELKKKYLDTKDLLEDPSSKGLDAREATRGFEEVFDFGEKIQEGCRLKREIESVNGAIKKFNEDRRELLGRLKEKVVNLAMIHMEVGGMPGNR